MIMTHTPPNTYTLKGIIDVQVPESIAWFPQTLGWQILFTLLSALMLFVIYRAAKIHHKNRYRRQALKELSEINSDRPYQATCELFHLMKRVAVYLDKTNASKSGDDLLQFFVLTKTSRCVHFHHVLSKRALNEIWLPEAKFTLIPEQAEVLISQFREWVIHHTIEDKCSSKNQVKINE